MAVVALRNFTRIRLPVGRISFAARKAMKLLGLRGAIEINVVGGDEMRKINGRYRGKRSSTTVLSFSYKEKRRGPWLKGRTDEEFLGQIFLSAPDIIKSAKLSRSSFDLELTRLLIHAIVHIKGFRHDTNREEIRMSRVEKRVCKIIFSE